MNYITTFLFVFKLLIIARAELKDRKLVEARIYGGKEKTQQKLGGYAVQIYLYHKLICGGGLLSRRHVLTAAHCFGQADKDEYHVIAGATEQMNYFGAGDQKNRVLKLLIHPNYQKTRFIADIAVVAVSLTLKGPTLSYLPLCSVEPSAGNMATVSGWGDSEYSRTDNSLRAMEVPIISESECSQKMERQMPGNVICAGGYNKRTLCHGDSGGPLVINGELCGVSTWTWKCGNSEMPDIYMSIYFYRDFINKTITQMGN